MKWKNIIFWGAGTGVAAGAIYSAPTFLKIGIKRVIGLSKEVLYVLADQRAAKV